MASVATWTFSQKLGETLKRSLPKLGPDARAQISALITKEALGIMAVVLAAWVVSHAFGVGEVVDLVIVGIGAIGLGWSIFQGIDELYEFALGTYSARTTDELEVAAGHFAKAIAILGVQAVLAVLFRGAPKTFRGGISKAGPRTAVGAAYRATLRWTKFERGVGRLGAGQGWTTSWGDIVVSSRGSAKTRQLVMLHEKIHQMLTPKVAALRNFRISNRNASYRYSSLSRYLEEALAESYAQLKVNGVTEAFGALRFPIQNKYVYLLQRGGYSPAMQGQGIIPEILGLAVGSFKINGLWYDLFVADGDEEPGAEEEDLDEQPQVRHGASGSW
jgi:hypothetical protein